MHAPPAGPARGAPSSGPVLGPPPGRGPCNELADRCPARQARRVAGGARPAGKSQARARQEPGNCGVARSSYPGKSEEHPQPADHGPVHTPGALGALEQRLVSAGPGRDTCEALACAATRGVAPQHGSEERAQGRLFSPPCKPLRAAASPSKVIQATRRTKQWRGAWAPHGPLSYLRRDPATHPKSL